MKKEEKQFPVLMPNYIEWRIEKIKSIPWNTIKPHEKQAIKNHSQSLETLAERGGLDWIELYAVLTDRSLKDVDSVEMRVARNKVLKIIEDASRKTETTMDNRYKFRLWNPGAGEYTYFNNPALTFDGIDHSPALSFRAEDRKVYISEYTGIEQCTGITDMSGALIYEGDIIEGERYLDYGNASEYVPVKESVIWDCIKCAYAPFYYWGKINKIRVVGNISEGEGDNK
jgi:hypothetical protein